MTRKKVKLAFKQRKNNIVNELCDILSSLVIFSPSSQTEVLPDLERSNKLTERRRKDLPDDLIAEVLRECYNKLIEKELEKFDDKIVALD